MFKWKKCIVVNLVIILLLTDLPVFAKEPTETELYARAAVLMDAESGRVLYEKNGKNDCSAFNHRAWGCVDCLESGCDQHTYDGIGAGLNCAWLCKFV